MKILKLKNVIFKKDCSDGNPKTFVKNEIPRALFKFYSLNKFSVEAIAKSSLFFSHSHLLNDLMDGNFLLWDMDKFISKYRRERQFESNIPDNEIYLDILHQLIEPTLGCRGILSLTDAVENDLMWALYTSEIGFCIQLNSLSLLDLFKSSYFFPVSYYNSLKQLDFDKYIFREKSNNNRRKVDITLPILYSFAVKSNQWSYEREWRILMKKRTFQPVSHKLDINNRRGNNYLRKLETRNIPIPRGVIEKIILGPFFFGRDHFYKSIKNNEKNEVYYFNKENDNQLLMKFLKVLKIEYNEKIYLIDSVSIDNKIKRKIGYKIEILSIYTNYVCIKKIAKQDVSLS